MLNEFASYRRDKTANNENRLILFCFIIFTIYYHNERLNGQITCVLCIDWLIVVNRYQKEREREKECTQTFEENISNPFDDNNNSNTRLDKIDSDDSHSDGDR